MNNLRRVLVRFADKEEMNSPVCDSEETAQAWIEWFKAVYECEGATFTTHAVTPLTMEAMGERTKVL